MTWLIAGKKTLYDKLKEIESSASSIRGYTGVSHVNVHDAQCQVIKMYQDHPVIAHAIHANLAGGSSLTNGTVKEQFTSLSKANRGIRKFLPRRKDSNHNKRLEELGDIIPEPTYLKKSGIFTSDNFVSSAGYMVGMIYGVSYALSKWLLPDLYIDPAPEFLEQKRYELEVLMPGFTSALMAPIFGFLTNLGKIFPESRRHAEQAEYIDRKIKEFYMP